MCALSRVQCIEVVRAMCVCDMRFIFLPALTEDHDPVTQNQLREFAAVQNEIHREHDANYSQLRGAINAKKSNRKCKFARWSHELTTNKSTKCDLTNFVAHTNECSAHVCQVVFKVSRGWFCGHSHKALLFSAFRLFTAIRAFVLCSSSCRHQRMMCLARCVTFT